MTLGVWVPITETHPQCQILRNNEFMIQTLLWGRAYFDNLLIKDIKIFQWHRLVLACWVTGTLDILNLLTHPHVMVRVVLMNTNY